MKYINPFGMENALSPSTGLGLDKPMASPTPRKGGEAELSSGQGVSYETRRAELSRDVRKYADKKYARLLGIYKKYGATDAAGMQRNILSDKTLRLDMGDVQEIEKILKILHLALSKNEIPERRAEELPPYEAFKEVVDRLNEQLSPRQVTGFDRWEDYELIDGRLNGRIKIDHKWLPLIAGEVLEELGGNLLEDCEDVRNVDGKLNGVISVDGFRLPVINGNIVGECEGFPIRGCSDIRNVNGKLNGILKIGDKWRPVIDGMIIEKIENTEIIDCQDVINVDGMLNGIVTIKDTEGINRRIPVINGVLVDEIEGEKIEDCEDIRNVDGKLNGRVRIIDDRWLPVIDGKLVERIEDRIIGRCRNVRNIDGTLNGEISEVGKRALPVINGERIKQLEGKRIGNCFRVRNVEGGLSGLVQFESGADWLFPVIAGELVKKVGNEELVCLENGDDDISAFSDAGGRFSGLAWVGKDGGKRKCVVLGEAID